MSDNAFEKEYNPYVEEITTEPEKIPEEKIFLWKEKDEKTEQ